MDMFRVLFLVFALPCFIFDCKLGNAYNVMDYGAKGDGQSDDSQAFRDAWNTACSDPNGNPRIEVPQSRTFLVKPVMFTGPCSSPQITFMISGTIISPGSTSFWDGMDASQWLGFKHLRGLVVDGFGSIDGRGKSWWDQSCRYHPKLKRCTTLAPTALKFLSCNDTSVSNLRFKNSAQTHVLVKGCNNVSISNLDIRSPGHSPNTDGIHIHASTQVIVNNSKIGCGDDCISIGDHVTDIQVEHVVCGPGHGISIGSLGKGGKYVQVEKIHVSHTHFKETTNGARIKTWQVGRGYVRDVIFQNLEFNNVKNPIIIDQNYCSVSGACEEMKTGVEVSNVSYKKIRGTSRTDIAINLNCSKSVPCTGISMNSVRLKSYKTGRRLIANCNKAYGQEIDVVPGPCLIQSQSSKRHTHLMICNKIMLFIISVFFNVLPGVPPIE